MSLDDIQDLLSFALQGDLEHGVAFLNEKASEEFAATYPELNKAIGIIMDLEEIDYEDMH